MIGENQPPVNIDPPPFCSFFGTPSPPLRKGGGNYAPRETLKSYIKCKKGKKKRVRKVQKHAKKGAKTHKKVQNVKKFRRGKISPGKNIRRGNFLLGKHFAGEKYTPGKKFVTFRKLSGPHARARIYGFAQI